MKKILTLMVVVMALGALGADVEFPLVDLTGGPTTNRRVLIQPVELQGAANKLPLMDLAPRVSDAEGRCWVSNMVAGLYSVTVQGPPSTTRYQILVPETNGVLNARALLVGSTNVPGVGVAYTAAASDARYPLRSEVNTGEGISLAQATAAAAAVVETNTTAVTATLQAAINTASNAAFSSAVAVAGSSVTASNTGLPESFYLSAGAVPIMGWHSWNTQGQTNLWATNILAAIDGLHTNGLVPYGWNWVEIDDNVFTSTNAQGLLIPDPVRWPNGIKSVVDYAHERGIKVMLYSELGKYTDGMSFATNADGSYVWPSYGTQNKHVENGHQFASWGIDGVWTHGDWTTNSTPEQSYKRMVEYYRAVSTNRPIYFLSIHSKHKPWGDMERLENSGNWSCWYPATGISQDVASDMLAGMEMLIDITAQPHVSKTIRPGHHIFLSVYPLIPSWIKMGFGGAAMFPGPLMITTWPSEWKILPLETKQIMTNSDFIAILQDKDVVPAVKVLDMPTLSYDWIKAGYIPVNPNATNVISAVTNSVWYRPLSTPGSFAVFCLNRGSNAANIYFSRTNFPVAPTTYKMFDVWARTNMADLTNQTVTVSVPSNSISIYRLSLPPSVTATVADADISIPLILENPVADNGGGNAWVFQITNSANATGMKMGQILGNQGWHGIQLWNGPNFGYDTCSLLGTTNQTAFGVPNASSLFTWRAGANIIASMQGSGALYANGIGITNIPLTGVSGLPAALAWLTNNTGSSTGAVSSVNGLTGAVVLDAAAVGAQYGTPGLTNLAGFSTNNPAFSGVIFVETNEYGAGIQTPGGEPFTFHASPIFPSSAIFSAMPQMQAGIWMGDDNSGINLLHETGNLSVGGGLVVNGEISATGGIAATNLTGTIDAARLPPATTNTIWGGINLSNPAVNAIYMLSITTNTTLGNFGNMHASEFRTAQLWITNGGASSQPLTLPAGTSCPDGNPLYVTNGQRRCVSVGGIINFTNAISRALP